MFRYSTFRILILAIFALLIAGLFNIQIIKGPYYFRQSEHNRIRVIPLLAPRGNIYDRNGVVLAGSRPSYNVSVLPGDFDKNDIPKLAQILNITEKEIKDRVKRGRKVSFMPVVLARGVDAKIMMMIEEAKPDFGGVLIQVESVRDYPFGEDAAHLVGYVGRVSKNELEQDDEERYQLDDLIGRAGIEKGLDDILRGENGGLQVEVDSRGKQTQVLSERKTQKGQDVTLAIDMRLQSRVEEIMGDAKGAVGMMDLESGDILVWVSQPSYDPNIFIDPTKGKERAALMKDPFHPMMDRGLRSSYPPGSVFKVVTALAALEKGVVNINTSFFCKGFFRLKPGSRPFKCWYSEGHQVVNITKALERSCDVFFYNAGRMLEPEEIAAMSRRLGIGEPEDVEVPFIVGTVPDKNWKRNKVHDMWYQGDTINYSIGQGFLLTTPLELMRMMGAVALENEMPSPHFVKGMKPQRKKINLNHDDVKIVKNGLLKVVESDFGTGQYARVPFMKFCGKTGTAQCTGGASHAWFSGFFPYEKPKVAFICFVEHGKSGGFTCGKIMNQVLLAWNEIMNDQPKKKTVVISPQPRAMVQPVQPNQNTGVRVHVGD